MEIIFVILVLGAKRRLEYITRKLLFNVKKRNNRKRREKCLKLTMKTPE